MENIWFISSVLNTSPKVVRWNFSSFLRTFSLLLLINLVMKQLLQGSQEIVFVVDVDNLASHKTEELRKVEVAGVRGVDLNGHGGDLLFGGVLIQPSDLSLVSSK